MGEASSTPRAVLRARQWDALREVLAAVRPANHFQARKLLAAGVDAQPVASLAEFAQRVPWTVKTELVADQAANPPYGTNLTFPLDRYTRCHQTSGTSGAPLRWLDTPESWSAQVELWAEVHRAAGVGRGDRVFFAFSFGPFIGFWMAFEAAERLGALCLPGGGLTTPARLRLILDHGATVLCCTPTYALHLAEVATQEGISLAGSRVRRIMVAGEPGGSIPATRARIESLWPGARVFDHHGMTEVGPVTHECPVEPGVLHVMESGFLAEVIDPYTGAPSPAGARGELVLTTLQRTGSPLLRYRTGDLVQPRHAVEDVAVPACACGRSTLALAGGIVGRVDDMVIVRGVNLYPSAVEAVLRGFPEIAEFQVVVTQPEGLTDLTLRIEPAPGGVDAPALAKRVAAALQVAFALRFRVFAVSPGDLPRYELKARRWVRR